MIDGWGISVIIDSGIGLVPSGSKPLCESNPNHWWQVCWRIELYASLGLDKLNSTNKYFLVGRVDECKCIEWKNNNKTFPCRRRFKSNDISRFPAEVIDITSDSEAHPLLYRRKQVSAGHNLARNAKESTFIYTREYRETHVCPGAKRAKHRLSVSTVPTKCSLYYQFRIELLHL